TAIGNLAVAWLLVSLFPPPMVDQHLDTTLRELFTSRQEWVQYEPDRNEYQAEEEPVQDCVDQFLQHTGRRPKIGFRTPRSCILGST
ncbi:MAG TPA: hypothetical protein VMP10_05230, partial [Chloroflexota bacterium]|nr:hypothetical protein [Chloroflexota bacterium]